MVIVFGGGVDFKGR